MDRRSARRRSTEAWSRVARHRAERRVFWLKWVWSILEKALIGALAKLLVDALL